MISKDSIIQIVEKLTMYQTTVSFDEISQHIKTLEGGALMKNLELLKVLNQLINDKKVTLSNNRYFLIPKDVQEFELNKTPFRKIEPGCFVYFLISEDVIIYIGQTTQLQARIGWHFKDKIFDKYHFYKCDVYEVDKIERYFINLYLPELNRDFATNAIRKTLSKYSK